MALYLKVSNSLTHLADQLCSRLQVGRSNVFQPYYIVTQTEGMNNWLKLQLAENLGIAANCRFIKPNDIIYHIFKVLGGKYRQDMAPQKLSWVLYRLLQEKEFRSKYSHVARYYEGERSDEVKRMALAEKVADLFDQYQIYRPDMIRKWNSQSPQVDESDEWQRFLWSKVKTIVQDQMPDKTYIAEFIDRKLREPGMDDFLARELPSVHVFGLSVITSYHLQLFSNLARDTDFYFYLLNPAPEEYWFEDRSEKQLVMLKKKGWAAPEEQSLGNPLLVSWGRLISQTFSLFFENDALINAYEEIDVTAPDNNTLLHAIQQDIFYNRNADDRNKLGSSLIRDGSLTINACYTPAREVEVLYNYLVHLVSGEMQKLSARDIVVMVSDIDAYAPYIRAVFNNAPYTFPYTIADESYTANDNLTNALQSILKLNRNNFKAEEVLQLLDSAYIRNRFGLSDLTLLRKVVDLANIRFGMQGDLSDETHYVSWKYGLDRIIYGICMSGEEEYTTPAGETLYPLDLVEGQSSLEIIRFCHFVEVLMASVHEREHARTIAGWIEYVEMVLHDLVFEPGEDIGDDYEMLLKQLEQYNAVNDLLPERISYEVFTYAFLQEISSSVRSGSFISGGITFCSLIPMRSIPFEVVALLGLNFDKFPRKEVPLAFNLMEKEKKKGDRNIKENDKHLFLETVLSARRYLYISYIGYDVRDNSPLPPSALVDELIDYIEAGATEEDFHRELLVSRHPLHNFSRLYQNGDPRFYNYLNDRQEKQPVKKEREREKPSIVSSEVSLDSVIRFFKNPIKGYYNDVAEIYYHYEETLLPETELFEVDPLRKWQLKQDLLSVPSQHLGQLRSKLVKTGGLPLGNMADIALSAIDTEVAPVRELFESQAAAYPRDVVSVEIRLDDDLLTGTIDGIYGPKLIVISWSKHECKYLIEAYIKYLAARAAGLSVDLCFISGEKKSVFSGNRIETTVAQERLAAILQLYKEGHERILSFNPDFEFSPSKIDELNQMTWDKTVKDQIDAESGRCRDPYILREFARGFFNGTHVLDDYKKVASVLVKPLAEVFPQYYQKQK